MKKIIFVHLFNDYSGSPLILSHSISALKGYPSVVVTSDSDGFLSNVPALYRRFTYKWSNNKIITLLRFLRAQASIFCRVYKELENNSIVYVNTMLPFGASLAAFVKRKTVIYHIHETTVNPVLFKQFLRMIIRLTSSKNIYVSHYLAQQERVEGVSSDVIYNSLSEGFYAEAFRHTYDPLAEKIMVLMACSLKAYKGIYEFVEIAKRCNDVNSTSFCLVLNATVEDLESFKSNIEVPDNLHILPSQSNMIEFYKSATVVLNLSRTKYVTESFGMTILEAMSFGIPCIVPPVGGPCELVDDGVNGYLIDSQETDKIANTIINLSSDRPLLKELSDAARKKSAEFSNDAFSKSIQKVIDDL